MFESPAQVAAWKVWVPGDPVLSSLRVSASLQVAPPSSERENRMALAGQPRPGTGTLRPQTRATFPSPPATRRGADSPWGAPTSPAVPVTRTGAPQVAP